MYNLPLDTWIRFFVWCAVGLLVYFGYSYQHSTLGREEAQVMRRFKLRKFRHIQKK